jgi:hypothetical protein
VAVATAAVAEHIGRIALLGLGVAPGRRETTHQMLRRIAQLDADSLPP